MTALVLARPRKAPDMTTTADPTKHLLGYGRRDPSTGMLHGHIHYPDGRPPVPSGCRWCGQAKGEHGLWWRPGKGYHSYEPPTQAQIKARMRARRKARLAAGPVKYHAVTGQAPDETGEAPIDYCADCGTSGCRQWMRIQYRQDRRRMELAGINPKRRSRKAGGGWGGGEPWPF